MSVDKGFIDRANDGRRVRRNVALILAFACALIGFVSIRATAAEPVRMSLTGVPLALEHVNGDVTEDWSDEAALITLLGGVGVLAWTGHRRRNS